MSLSTHISFILDENDIVRSVDTKSVGASDNPCASQQSHLQHAIGESFWNLVVSREQTSFYRLILKSVRGQGQSVTVPFHCEKSIFPDSETITFSPLPKSKVLATTRSMDEKGKPGPLSLIEENLKEENFVYRCSWCQSIREPSNSWKAPVEEDKDPLMDEGDLSPITSHGICPACFEKEISDLGEDRR